MRNQPFLRLLATAVASPRVIFAVAFVMRLVVAAQLLPAHAWRGFYEQNEAARIAWAVVSGFGYSSPWPHTPLAPTAQQPPVYPYLLAGIFKLFGPYTYLSLWIAVVLNAFFAGLTAMVILQIGKRDFGASTGILAAWVWSCWLYQVVVSILLWESSLSALLLALGLWLLLNPASSLRRAHALLFGGLAGVSALTNTTLLSVFSCFWLWFWIRHRSSGRSCRNWLLASMAMCLLTLLPWTIRNYVVFQRLFPVRDNLGLELWIGNHDGVTHLFNFNPDFPLVDATEFNRVGEIRFMETKRQIALQFIRQHPREFLHLSAERCFYYWTTPDTYLWLPMSLLAWLGVVLALWRKGLDAVPYAIVLLVFPLIYYVTHPWSTYRHPMESVMILSAAYAAVSAAEAALRPLLRSSRTRMGQGLA